MTEPAFAALAPVLEDAARVAAPPPARTGAEWADANRILPKGSAEPGRWRTSRVPYTRAIYEAFCDPAIERVIVVMGSQMSKTETILNVAGHRLDDGPYAPVLYVGPTEKNVRTMSNDRFTKMIESTPALYDKLQKGNDDKVTEKFFAGIRLGFAWSGSATELASNPAGLVLVDERDRMDQDVKGEGDPVELAAARALTYANRKIGVFSTPTVEDASAIVTLFDSGTKMFWCFRCLHCDTALRPELRLLEYDKDAPERELARSAVLMCPECGGTHSDRERPAVLDTGHYVPHAKAGDGDYQPIERPDPSSVASFWANGLASPWVTFGERAVAIAKAYRSRDPSTIQAVINTGFGQTFKVRGKAPPWEVVYRRRVDDPPGHVPSWSQLVTMGVDVQKDGIYYVIRAWGVSKRSHLVRHGFIFGQTEYDDVWVKWQRLLELEHDRRPLIRLSLVDSGYNPKRDSYRRPDHKIYEVCRRTSGIAFPSKGHERTEDAPVKANKIDVHPSGRIIRGGIHLFHVNTDYFKRWVHAQIEPPEGVESNWTLHRDTDDDYCRQVVAEECVVKPSGRREWILPNKRPNHYFDCEVLAAAAATVAQVDSLTDIPEALVEPVPEAPPAAEEAPEFIEDFEDFLGSVRSF